MTVRELLARHTGPELSRWLAFCELEPLEDGYWQAAMVASTFANVMGSGKRRFQIADFLPSKRRAPRRIQSAEEGKAIIMGMIRRQQNSRV
jgi:hypothetical protein